MLRRIVLLLGLLAAVVSPAAFTRPVRGADDRSNAGLPAIAGQTFRLYEGVTAYVVNPEGKDFEVAIDVRDVNFYANGPREVLFKVYDPEGNPVVREVIPDDGCTTGSMQDRIGGWDHDMQCYTDLFSKGTQPWARWGVWSDRARLKTIVARTFVRPIKGGKKGVYRVMLAGMPDHYVTLRLTPELKYGVAGHATWFVGSGDALRKAYVYVPQGTSGLFLALAEPDRPRGRQFKLTAPDGKVLFEGGATGGYVSPSGDEWRATTAGFAGGQYAGKLLTFEASEGANDFMVRVALQQKGGPFADYVGFASCAVFCPDEPTANAVAGGSFVADGDVFWHPFQAKFVKWLKEHKLDANEREQALRKQLQALCDGFRLIETSDGRGAASWPNWAYAMGYYGCDIFRPSWLLMKRDDVPAELKAIIKEGLLVAGDRLSFATGIERVNGNAFSQINVALWYSQRATDDAMQRDRFEVFWKRWTTEGWGVGAGLSPSGDSQEHFAHDIHYGSYILDNWAPSGNTWVKGGGILGDAADDPRFQQVMDRYYELYSFITCREANGRPVKVNSWSSRTANPPSGKAVKYWDTDAHRWKGDPGPDVTADVNGGHEWFAARRQGYYIVTFHGRLAPEWLSQTFEGQIGFGGGSICQFVVPGRGPVLAGTVNDGYGKGMHPTQWENFHIHSLVGERWDGLPVISGISEHDNARLNGDVVTSSGEVRGTHLRVTRTYTYKPDAVECAMRMGKSEDAQVMFLWGHEGRWSEMRLAYEMIPFVEKMPDGKTPTKVTADDGAALTTELIATRFVRIDRGGFGVEVRFEQPTPCKLGKNDTLLIEIVGAAPKPTPAERVEIKYSLVPFGQPAPGAEQPAPARPATQTSAGDKPGKASK